jgi:hypothetical protein
MLNPKESLLKPDPRNDHAVIDKGSGAIRRMAIEDLHSLVEPLALGPSVPEKIRKSFDTARNAFIYSWFDLDFVTLAEHQAYAVLETALRERITMAGGDPTPARGLQNLYEIAFKMRCLHRKDFDMPSPFDPTRTTTQFDIIRMLRNNLFHGNTHLVPGGSLEMIRLCAEVITKMYPPAPVEQDDTA